MLVIISLRQDRQDDNGGLAWLKSGNSPSAARIFPKLSDPQVQKNKTDSLHAVGQASRLFLTLSGTAFPGGFCRL